MESPATNPLIPGNKIKEGGDLEEHFKEHDILKLGDYWLAKDSGRPDGFILAGPVNGQEIKLDSLEDAEKILEGLSREEIKDLFFK